MKRPEAMEEASVMMAGMNVNRQQKLDSKLVNLSHTFSKEC